MDYKARMYDPALKRFLQPDSIIPGGTSQSLNRYSYVLNSPIGFSDPTGHMQSCGVNGEDDCQPDIPSPLPPSDGDNGGDDASGHHHPHGEEANDWEPTTQGEAAAFWAFVHKDSPNTYENDCTNFISWALYYAGLNQDGTWHSNGNDPTKEAAWYTSWKLYSHLTDSKTNGGLGFESAVIGNTYGSKIQNNQNLHNFMKTSNLEKGDLVFFTADGHSEPSHVAIIVGFDNNHIPLIVEHSGPDEFKFSLPRTLSSSQNPTITSISFVFLPRQAP